MDEFTMLVYFALFPAIFASVVAFGAAWIEFKRGIKS